MVTKRQLGFLVVAVTTASVVGVIAVDIIGAGRWSGFGPLQRIGIGLGFGAFIVGLILIKLGDRPA
jgi:hypothetical protein